MSDSDPYQAPAAEPLAEPARQGFPELDTPTLKKLRNKSHTVRSLGAIALLGIVGVGILTFLGERESSLEPLILVGLALFLVLVIYAAWWRPAWGMVVVGIYCGLLITSILVLNILGALIGIFGMLGVVGSRPLFGPGRLLHKDLENEWRHRKRHKLA